MQRTTPPPPPHPHPPGNGRHHPHSPDSPHNHGGHAPSDIDEAIIGSVGFDRDTPGIPRWDEDATDEADALAALFLGDADLGLAEESAPSAAPAVQARPTPMPAPAPVPAPRAAPPRRPLIEAVVLGHLPILASAWTASYAQLLAEHAPPPGSGSAPTIGLAKLRGGYLSIEVFGPAARPSAPEAELTQVIAGLNRQAMRWLICTDATDEPALVYGCRPDGVTMLTAADDAAIVGSYRAIKGLIEGEPTRANGHHWPEEAGLTIALAGATPERARAAGDKLRSAVRTFLARQVDIEVCSQRIGPSPSECAFRGTWDRPIDELVDLLRAPALARQSTTATPATNPTPAAAAVTNSAPARMPAAVRSAPVAATPTPTPTPTPTLTPTSTAAKAAARLTSHAALIPGLTPIAITCPYAPGVELALCMGGQLHLLAAAEGLPALTTAAAWADAHASLLLGSIPALACDVKTGKLAIRCHILSEEPAQVRRLLESDLRVHLVVRTEVGGRSFAVTRALN